MFNFILLIRARGTTVGGGTWCRAPTNSSGWFGLTAQPNQAFYISGLGNGYQTCLGRIKPRFIYWTVTAAHYIGQVHALKMPPRCPK